jgi:ribosome-associated toxin RatA of RatAB toxin-antitoxin module
MARHPLIVALLVALAHGPAPKAQDPDQVQDEAPWKDAGTKDGIALALRDNRQLGAREVRATAEMPFPAAHVYAVVCDFSQYAEFVPGVREARTLEGTSPADYVAYLRYAPQFLVVAARDVVLQVSGGERPDGTFTCTWSAVEDRLPRTDSAVRMRLDTGSWVIAPIDDGRTQVVYQVAVDPGGRLPGWLVRWGATRAMPDVMTAMRRRLASTAAGSSAISAPPPSL